MPQKKYSHIFFDLDNTLWDFESNARKAMMVAFDHFKISQRNVAFDLFFECYTCHNDFLWNEYRKNNITKNELITKRFGNTFNEMGLAGIDTGQFNTFYLDRMPEQTGLVDGAEDLLKYLSGKKYLMYIITNGFHEVQHKKLKTAGIEKYFQKVFISEDVKMPKPHRGMFEYAVKSANARKRGSLMIGDDPDVDVSGALQSGIDAILFDPFRKYSEIPGSDKIKNQCYKIGHLSELKDFL